jgi:nucleotide-binding universal stress UspA family protein
MGHVHKMLVPIDDSACSMSALGQAVALAEDLGAEVELLHIAPADERALDAVSPSEEEREESARAMAAAVAEADRRLGARLTRRTDSGDPVRKILEIATAEHADLIVMGTHGRIGRLRALLGSVAEEVVRNSPCPVLTVRVAHGEEESYAERIHGTSALAEQVRSGR